MLPLKPSPLRRMGTQGQNSNQRSHRRGSLERGGPSSHPASPPTHHALQSAVLSCREHQHDRYFVQCRSQQVQQAETSPLSYVETHEGQGEDLGWRDDFHTHYIQGKNVGSGSFGEVFLGINLHNGKEVAIKSLPKIRGKLTKDKTLEKLAREVDILETLQGDSGIIDLVDCFEDNSSVKIVTELCTGGDLQNFIEKDEYIFNEASLSLVAHEVVKVVHYCHGRGMLHGDVKPANFCIKDKVSNPLLHSTNQQQQQQQGSETATAVARNWLKAIDFGCSQPLPGLRSLTKRTGTPVYMAPEIFGRRYHAEADMWSVGVMLYQLYARRFPFWGTMDECKASKLDEVALAVTEAQIPYDFGPWLEMSEEGLEFIKGCLTRDPHCRMTVEEALVHPWLQRHTSSSATLPLASSQSQQQQQQKQQAKNGNNIVMSKRVEPVGVFSQHTVSAAA